MYVARQHSFSLALGAFCTTLVQSPYVKAKERNNVYFESTVK